MTRVEKCPICGEEYFINRKRDHWKKNQQCKEQILIQRENLYVFTCDCGEKYKTQKALTQHKRSVHGWKNDKEINGVECRICGVKRHSLKNHIKTHGVSVEEYEEKYGKIELSDKAKQNYSQQNKINAAMGIEKQRERLKDPEYKKWYGEKISSSILASEKALETRRQNMIKLNKSEEQRNKASLHLKKKWKEEDFNSKCHGWQEDKEKLNNALVKGFYNTDVATYSSYESSLVSWLKSLKLNIDTNNRKILNGKELDLFLKDFNIAIEFDGLYWHSDKFKDKYYHINKTKECESKGIYLIHIFEDEWKSKCNIVKSRLKYVFGLNIRKIGARKCIIKEIDTKSKDIFLDQYHLQGTDKSSIKLGAYYENELIGVMTFGKSRIFMNKKSKKGVWELSRFATIPDTYTPGLASKILTCFEKVYRPEIIESFADRRWSQGNLYKQLGFELVGETAPNYWYSKSGYVRYHRYKFRKSELKKFDNYNDDKTEFEIMDEAGWHRIYDCGSYRFVKNIKKD